MLGNKVRCFLTLTSCLISNDRQNKLKECVMNGWKYNGLYVHIWVSASFITGHKSTLVSKFQISKFAFHEVRVKIKATGNKNKNKTKKAWERAWKHEKEWNKRKSPKWAIWWKKKMLACLQKWSVYIFNLHVNIKLE